MKDRSDTSPYNDRIMVFPAGLGRFTGYLRTNITPLNTEVNGEVKTEYRSQLYVATTPSSETFETSEAAYQWFDEHFDSIIDFQNQMDEDADLKSEADRALERLNLTDYQVIKAAEAYLADRGISIRPDAEAWRESVRAYYK